MKKYLRQTILFLTSFCIYITLEVCFRGYSYPLMGIVAGIAMLIIDQINQKISWNIDLILQAVIGSFIVTMAELIIGEIWLYFGWSPMWDYSNQWMNYDGVICPLFSLLWVFISIIGIFIADAINYYVFEELPIPYYKIFGKVRIQFKEKKCRL